MRPRSPRRSSRVRKVKLQLPLKKPKESPRASINRRFVESDGLVENNVESERNQDPGPSNPQVSRSSASDWSCSKLDLECFVPVKRLRLAEIEEMTQNRSQPEEQTAITQQVSPSPSPSSPMEMGPDSGIMQLPDEVLQYMLQFVTFADVKAARLVNKHWRQVATTPLRRSSKEIRLDHFVFECVTDMDDEQFPVYRLEVQLYDDPLKAKVTFPYFSGICAWVKELTLKMDIDMNTYDKSQIRVVTGTFPRDCIYQDLTHFNLRIFERTRRHPEFWKEFTDFVQNILKNSPNLREVNVDVQYLNYKGRTTCTVIEEDLFPDSNSVGISKLRSIDFHMMPLEKIDLAKWSTLNFKLRKLEIALSLSSDLNALLAKFLETQTGTLKELTLNLNSCYSNRPAVTATFIFPRLEKLEQLGFTSGHATFPGIDYARLFPCLKKLDLGGVDWMDFFGNNLLQATNTVEELIFPRNLRTPAAVASAARVFPALRKVEISALRVLTEAVYENMPTLEVLRLIFVYYSSSFDEVITGVRSVVCDTFNGVMTDAWINKLKTTESRSMARLQNLKTLKLTNDSYNHIRLSQLSLHVFKQMSSLKCLDLNGWGQWVDRRESFSYYYNYNDKYQKERQLLADLRANFVVL